MDIQSSQVLKLLLTTHQKRTTLHKKTLQAVLKISRPEIVRLLKKTSLKIKSFFLRLVPLLKSEITTIEDADRFYITEWYGDNERGGKRRGLDENAKRMMIDMEKKEEEINKGCDMANNENGSNGAIKRRCHDIIKSDASINNIPVNENVVDLNKNNKYLIVFIIIFLESGIISLDRLTYFVSRIDGIVDKDLVYEMKREHYLSFFKRDDVIFVTYDWRFVAEWPHFNPMVDVECFCLGVERDGGIKED